METVRDPTPPPTAQAIRDYQRKQAYQAAQVEARQLAETVNRVLDRKVLEVAAHPTVWLVDDGAFVEAVVWVPRERGEGG